jgi:hypothetical protein
MARKALLTPPESVPFIADERMKRRGKTQTKLPREPPATSKETAPFSMIKDSYQSLV